MSYETIHIVRKLNDRASTKVLDIVRLVLDIAYGAGLETTESPDAFSIIVAVGGDGTMLEAMRVAQRVNARVIGINMGNVGFLTELSANDRIQLQIDMQNLFRCRHSGNTEQRWFIRADAGDWQATAGNEVSVAGEKSDEMIRYRLLIDGADAGVHRANSLLVSTPTGSSAYSMSAGGALMVPNMRAMQIVPVAPFSLTSRPIIVSGSSVIRIEAWGARIAVRSDGTERYVADRVYTEDDPFLVTLGIDPDPVNVLHTPRWNYFNVLAEKLGWIKE